MKKTLLIFAAAAALLAGCTKNDVVSFDSDRAIAFSGYSGRAVSKAYADYAVSNGFRALGMLNDTTVYFNDTFSNLISTSGSSATYYWPNMTTNKLSFFAVAPSTTNFTTVSGSSTVKIDDFTADGETDLVVAKTAPYTSIVDTIPLQFNHALAKIAKVVLKTRAGDGTATSGYKYFVDSLKINGYSTGDYTLNTSDWSDTTNKTDYYYITSVKTLNGDFGTDTLNTTYAVLPQKVSLSVKYHIETAGGTTIMSSRTKTGATVIQAGNAYIFNVTLPGDALTPIKFNADVTPWVNVGGIDL